MSGYLNKIKAEGPELTLSFPVSEGFCVNFPVGHHCWMPSAATCGCPADLRVLRVTPGISQFFIIWHVVFHV